MRVVVVGASGFLGGALVDHFRGAGRTVIGFARRKVPHVDVAGSIETLGAVLETGDLVLNAAGIAIKDAKDSVQLVADNLRIAIEVARACVEQKARLLHLSSADIWPVADRSGAQEDTPVIPDTAYGLSKLMAELALSDARRRTGLLYTVLRPTYVVGPGMFEGRLFPAVLRQLARGGQVRLSGDPEARTDYLFLDDFLRAVELASIKSGWDGDCFHVGSGRLSTAQEVVESLAAAWGTPAELVFDATRTATPQQGPISIAKIATLGFRPSFPLAEACRAFVVAQRATAERG